MSNVPKLRFKEFGGEWEEKTLGHLIKSLDAGVSVNSTDQIATNGQKAILKTSCVSYGTFNINENKLVYENNEISRLKEPVKANTIIMSRMNTPALVGANAFVKHDNKNVFLPDRLWAAKIKPTACPQWTAILTGSSKIRDLLSIRATGTSNSMKNITKGDVLTLPVVVPSKQEQEKIASFLTSVDTKIEQLTKKETLLQEYKKGVMNKIFNQEIRFKDDDGSEFPEWEDKKLGKLSDVRDGTHDSPKYYDEGYPLITSKNLLQNGTIDFNNVSLILKEDYININKRSKVNINDILFGMIGTIGNPVIVNKEGFAIKNVALIKEQELLLNRFLIHYLKSFLIEKQFYEQNTGGTQKFIALGVIRDLQIKLPCLEEQTKIANFLSSIDKKIELTTKELNSTKEFKKALLQQMFV